MKSRQVQLIVLAVAVVALVGIVWRTLAQSSSPSDEAARMVRGNVSDEDLRIEDTPTVQRERPSRDSARSPSRLGGAETAADAATEEAADEEQRERKTRKDRTKRSGRRKVAADSDRDDTPADKPKGPKVRVSGKRVKKGGP